MKNKLWNVLILLGGAFIFLTAHFYQTDTDQVSVKQTVFQGKSLYRYVPDYPVYKRPGYRTGTNWYPRDYSSYKTDSSLLFDQAFITLYDVTNKTKDYLVVPVTLSWEVNTSTSSDASYTVIGAVSTTKHSLSEYFILDPNETMKGMYSFSKVPSSFKIAPEAATVVDKKWVQGLQQAVGGDRKKLEQYLKDTVAISAHVKMKEKLSEILQAELVKNISLKFNSMRATGKSYGYPVEFNVQVENKNPYNIQTTVLADCFGNTGNISLLANKTGTFELGINRKAACDTLNPKLSIKKVNITGLKN